MKTRLYFLDNLRTFLIFLVILYHAGFTYQNAMQGNWIVVDPIRNDSLGLIGLYLDVFVMAAMFFISGYFISASIKNKSSWLFIKGKLRRIMLPWSVAVLTLIPAYKALFLYSRGLPQQEWFSYFHVFQRAGTDLSFFANDPSQHWLWFLPILFLFQLTYLGLSKINWPSVKISLKTAVIVIFFVAVAYGMTISIADLRGWTLTAIFDFQRERLLVYFMFFLLGALCDKLNVFTTESSGKRYFIIANIVLTVAISLYTVLAINFLLNMITPGRDYFFIAQHIDGTIYYSALMLLMFAFLYILLYTFKTRFHTSGKIMTQLNSNSYNVYIIHMIVLGIIALALVNISLPTGIKYLLLAVLTFVVSNVIVFVYRRFLKNSVTLKVAAASLFIIGLIGITHSGHADQPAQKELQQTEESMPDPTTQGNGLHEAVIQGNLAAVNQFIISGADLDIAEPAGGSSPLITAAVFGKTEIAQSLISAGADINFKNNDGSTALITAAFFCHIEIVELLLDQGADPNIINKGGSTALQSVSGSFEEVKGIYDYFRTALGPLGFELSNEEIIEMRPQIEKVLKNI